MLPRLSFPAHVGHVVARLANGAGEDGRAIALDMLVEPDAGANLGQHVRKRGLTDLGATGSPETEKQKWAPV
jgi:hypothetical protein